MRFLEPDERAGNNGRKIRKMDEMEKTDLQKTTYDELDEALWAFSRVFPNSKTVEERGRIRAYGPLPTRTSRTIMYLNEDGTDTGYRMYSEKELQRTGDGSQILGLKELTLFEMVKDGPIKLLSLEIDESQRASSYINPEFYNIPGIS